jgi:t-SNARE complex subunit (syntaxin)
VWSSNACGSLLSTRFDCLIDFVVVIIVVVIVVVCVVGVNTRQ